MEAGTPPAMEHIRAPGLELPEWLVTTEELERTEMAGKVLWASEDGKRAMGVWRGTPGTVRGTFLTDEVSVIVTGSMRVLVEGGDEYEVSAGDVIRMDAGLTVTWKIEESVTKVFNVYAEDGLPF